MNRTAAMQLNSNDIHRMCSWLLLALTLPLSAPAADILYQTSFEAPAFAPGLPIRGQDNWEMFHEGEAISVSTSNARTGDQCLRFDGALLEPQANGSSTAYCFSRALEALATPPPIVEITASVRLDGPPTGTAGTPEQDILSANLMAVVSKPGGEGESLGGFYVSSGGRIWTYSRVPEDNYKFSVPYVFGTYRTLTLRVDFIGRQLTWLVDGIELGSGAFLSTITADRLLSGYLFLSGPTDPRSTPEYNYDPANYTAYFDDYSLASVPLSPVNVVIEFGKADFLTDEFRPAAQVRVIRRGFVDAPVRVTVNTTDETAKAGEDYEAVSTFVTFAAGETERIIEVPLHDDYWPEPDKSFRIRLTGLPPGATSPVSRATVWIRDDERPGSIDFSWSSSLGLPALAPGEVKYADPRFILKQPDGKMIFDVAELGDNELFMPLYWQLVRILPDGSVDPTYPIRESFPSGPGGGLVDRQTAVLPDGSLLIWDSDSSASTYSYRLRYKLRPDGSVEESFPTISTLAGAGFIFIPQPDGRILVNSGDVSIPTRLNGTPMPWLFRLESDGSLDTDFTAPTTISGWVRRVMVNGQVLVEGSGTVAQIYRLNNDGSLDTTFVSPSYQRLSFLDELANGQLLITVVQNNSGRLYRLNPDGSPDPAFSVGTIGRLNSFGGIGVIWQVLPQADGKLILAGAFETYNGQTRNSIVRLNPDGSVDPTFQTGQGFVGLPGTSGDPGQISGLRVLPGGRRLVPGLYERFDGQRVTSPIVLNSDGTRDPAFEGTVTDGYGDLWPVGWWNSLLQVDRPMFGDGYVIGRLRMDLPLRLVSTTRQADGATRLTANALAGRAYTLQSSENLTDWIDLSAQTATTNRIEFVDQPEIQPAARFYRVKQE